MTANKKIYSVVLAGGSGSRLWPMSRAMRPKQFLPSLTSNSMLQETLKRLDGLNISSNITICNEEHRFFVAEQLRELGKLDKIILEPVGRNTAPAIALAAFLKLNEDPILLVLPADHHISNIKEFASIVKKAIPLAQSGKLVTFGIVPTEAHTGYGYIEKGDPTDCGYEVSSFKEKPSPDEAIELISSNNFLWNSGMFLFKSSSYLNELNLSRPDIYKACKSSIKGIKNDNDFIRVDKETFLECPSDSIDYAVMEKTSDAVVIPLDVGWNDIGSWASMWEVSDKDDNGNNANGDIIMHDTNNSLIKSENQLVATVGIQDLVIVSTKDALLVANKNEVENVKYIVNKLDKEDRVERDFHREVFRPWGKYDSVDYGNRYQVKRITVNPGAKLSVQMHHHRSEHWVVVQGTAKVTKGDETFILEENESIYIPVTEVHALENPGDQPLELIEVQVGSYLGEDDIVRFDDKYGRS